METNARVMAKAASWQVSGLIAMTGIGYAFTGSFSQGGTMAFVAAAMGLVAYFVHEKIWAQVRWGCRPALHGAARPEVVRRV